METGGTDENVDATSKLWQLDADDNFAKTDGQEMKKTREGHGCGIVHSIHHKSRPFPAIPY